MIAFHEFSATLTAKSLKPLVLSSLYELRLVPVSRLPSYLPEDLASPFTGSSGSAGGAPGLGSPELELGIFECSNGVPKSGDFSVLRHDGGVTFLAGGGIEISFEGGSILASPLAIFFSGFFSAGMSAAGLSFWSAGGPAFLHPSLYVCARCLSLQTGHDANQGLFTAVKL